MFKLARERMMTFYSGELFSEKLNQHSFTINLNIDLDDNFDILTFLNISAFTMMITNLQIVIHTSIIIANKITDFFSIASQLFIITI